MLRELAVLGISRVEAGRRLGRDQGTLSRRVWALDIEWVPPPPPPREKSAPRAVRYWTEEERRKLEEMAAAGVGIGRAALEIDRDLGATWRKARSWGIRFRGQRS